MHAPCRLDSRTFLEADQVAFAALSGDRNPMHVDAVAARRTQAGAPVVHGVHAVLWALDLLLAQTPRRFFQASARFERFIYIGEAVEALVTVVEPHRIVLELRTGGSRAAAVTLGFVAHSPAAIASIAAVPAHRITRPAIRDVADLNGLVGTFALVDAPAALQTAFPALVAVMGRDAVRALAGLSTLVGMECPGLFSIFSKLSVTFGHGAEEGDGTLRYSVRRLQPLLRAATIDVCARGVAGSVEAFVRQPPVVQPGMADLQRHVPDAFARGDRVLVIGGSRGLGELTAKLAALAGAAVTVTYASGIDEARSVAAEIAAAGGQCDIAALDVTQPIAAQLASLRHTFTHCYYFATPPIFRKRGTRYDRGALDLFLTFYVDAFHAIVDALATANPAIGIFVPSSSAINERPKGALEYTVAKLAGEYLVTDLADHFPRARIVTTRFPRILTDQTATVLPVRSADPLALLLPVMHDLHRRG